MPMIRNRQFLWHCHQIVLMELDLMHAARRKPTANGEKLPTGAGGGFLGERQVYLRT
jgi:hypothetical protein